MHLLRKYFHSFLLIVFILSVTGCASQEALTENWHNYEADQYNRGLDAYNKKDYTTAFENWAPLAEKGFADAQINLALLYTTGRGVAKDYTEGIRWNRKAAEQGYPVAQNNMGVMYQFGQGIGQDNTEAIRWYTLAANQGYSKAEENLENLLATTQGISSEASEQAPAVTGTYVSDVRTNARYTFKHRYRNLMLHIKQEGNIITGTDDSGEAELTGTRNGDTITFNFWYSKVASTELTGTWKVSADATRLEGSWITSASQSIWNLNKIE